ncbi:MAG: glycosyltransferase family 1 protein [Bacilli bacterium]|nr:glycosyltransferase family 1 protein [Bacilli bacterium]
MNVFLDAQPLLGSLSGISRYVECLYQELCQVSDVNVTLAFNRIVKPFHPPKLTIDVHNKPILMNKRYPYSIIRRLMKPNLLYTFPFDLGLGKDKADLFHGTNFTHFPVVRGKSVVTIHDLAFMRFPDSTSKRIYQHHSRWVPYSAQKADRIIADSMQTKNDIIELLQVSPDKIDVIHLAADKKFRPLPEHEYRPITQKYNLPEKYILFVGTVEPRKNLLGLVQAYELLKQNHPITEKLVIVGARGWKYTPIFEWIQQHHLETDIIFTGYIEDDDLVALYNAATIFVLPSIYEGFGIPILEAMQCGIPVIASNVSSIPEVVGESGILVDPHYHEGWAKAMLRLLTDEQEHLHYASLSLKRGEHFNWHKVAQQTLQVYDKVMMD